MLTVTCLFVKGEYPYTAEYVERLYAGVKRHLDRPFLFTCLTDQPWLFSPPIETIPVQTWPTDYACWTKLEVFNPAREWPGRVLCLDLDVLVVGDLAPVVDFPAAFTTIDDELQYERPGIEGDRRGRRVLRRFNTSVMVLDRGFGASLYRDYAPSVSQRLSTDQDWLAEQLPPTEIMPAPWFPRLSRVGAPPFGPDVKVILAKKPKNVIAAAQLPWFNELWRAA